MTLASVHPTSDIAAHVESGAVQKGEVMAGSADDGNKARHPAICTRASDKSQGREDRISITEPSCTPIPVAKTLNKEGANGTSGSAILGESGCWTNSA